MNRTLLAAGAAVLAIAAAVTPAKAADTPATTMAIIGDIPYGAALIAEFPSDIQEINADPNVSSVVHLGDIKDGSSRCDDSYFQARLADFQTFDDPFIYTPGDNEWTDCHRANNGGYTPTERLAAVRRTFFPVHGQTLGVHAEHVEYQSEAYPENVRWTESGVLFGTVDVVGSDDDQDPWFTDRVDPATGQKVPETVAEKADQAREYIERQAASLQWLDAIFDAAERQNAPAVAIGIQADMFVGTGGQAGAAFVPFTSVLAARAARFGKPVLLLEGDSHTFDVRTPPGMPANVTRLVVEGSTNTPHEWLRLRVDPSTPQVFSCENVHFQTRVVTPCPAPFAPNPATGADTTAPTVSITSPADGAKLAHGATVWAAFSCADAGSGIQTCIGTVPNGEAVDTSAIGLHAFTVTATDKAGNPIAATVHYTVNSTSAVGTVGAAAPATLSLALNAPATFGAFTPGVANDYTTTTTATVISSAGNAALTVADPSAVSTGHLVNGAFALPSALQAKASSGAGTGGGYGPVGGAASPTPLLAYAAPTANDPVTLAFKQPIAATDALRSGTYAKALTFTLSTTAP